MVDVRLVGRDFVAASTRDIDATMFDVFAGAAATVLVEQGITTTLV